MSGATERDPRKDPRQSDVIRGPGEDGVRRACMVDWVSDGTVYFWQSQDEMADRVQAGALLRMPIALWRERAATAEIVHRAGDGAAQG